ncbi:hypothetical protein [Halorussus ruber]|uniref:hypothetical protein n=1 Tax=Halorussus ruber TaxID=1126238 RepID=UPI001092E73C|nr:hypothetical protein [Halorussus ruber]
MAGGSQHFRMADPELLARLDRIVLLLAALLAVELLEAFGWDATGVGYAVIGLAVVGFVFLWGKSVVGLVVGEEL